MSTTRHTVDQSTVSPEVLGDLVDAALQEGLVAVDPPEHDGGWGRVGTLPVRLRDGGALQRWRAVPGSVGGHDGRPLTPAATLDALGLTGPGAADLAEDLAAASGHGAVLRHGLDDVPSGCGSLLDGERVGAARGRPFHPTGRAVSGWSPDEVRALGPMRVAPLACAWVAVAREHLRLGPDDGSARLHEQVLTADDDPGRRRLADAMVRAGVGERTHQPLPVHPWQREHVLGRQFGREAAAGLVVGLDVEIGRLHPTSSIRTLVVAGSPRTHLKLPLGVATLGAARLLPPRYLDNGDRAERVLRDVLAADPELAALVTVCDEGLWVGWSAGDDEFDDRPGHLAAQVRRYPVDTEGTEPLAVPMAALAADRPVPGLDITDPVEFFAGLAGAFARMVVGFLAHGVLPEIHGQNVVVRLGPGGEVVGFVLRDHDALRIHPPWLHAAGVTGPDYRIRPGARQSLVLDCAEALVGFAQTLGFQVNLFAVADALARRYRLPEHVFWARLRVAVVEALERGDLRPEVTALIERVVLDAPRWPCRTLVGPLLAQGRSGSVSMPAGLGSVPNPLREGR